MPKLVWLTHNDGYQFAINPAAVKTVMPGEVEDQVMVELINDDGSLPVTGALHDIVGKLSES